MSAANEYKDYASQAKVLTGAAVEALSRAEKLAGEKKLTTQTHREAVSALQEAAAMHQRAAHILINLLGGGPELQEQIQSHRATWEHLNKKRTAFMRVRPNSR